MKNTEGSTMTVALPRALIGSIRRKRLTPMVVFIYDACGATLMVANKFGSTYV